VAPDVHGDAGNAGDAAQDRADFRLCGRGKSNICWFSVWNLLRVNLLAPGVSENLTPPRTGLPYKRMLIAVLARAGRRPVRIGLREFLFEAQYHGSRWAHEGTVRDVTPLVNLSALCMLCIGQSYRYSSENAFYMFS